MKTLTTLLVLPVLFVRALQKTIKQNLEICKTFSESIKSLNRSE